MSILAIAALQLTNITGGQQPVRDWTDSMADKGKTDTLADVVMRINPTHFPMVGATENRKKVVHWLVDGMTEQINSENQDPDKRKQFQARLKAAIFYRDFFLTTSVADGDVQHD